MRSSADINPMALRRSELVAIASTIQKTRDEIAGLRRGRQSANVQGELQEIVLEAENATNAILAAAESVNLIVNNIKKSSRQILDSANISALENQMQVIFESCNFQDITGQRIAKIVKTFDLIDIKISDMVMLWEIKEKDSEGDTLSQAGKETKLLNGPALPGAMSVSQSDVDSMF